MSVLGTFDIYSDDLAERFTADDTSEPLSWDTPDNQLVQIHAKNHVVDIAARYVEILSVQSRERSAFLPGLLGTICGHLLPVPDLFRKYNPIDDEDDEGNHLLILIPTGPMSEIVLDPGFCSDQLRLSL